MHAQVNVPGPVEVHVDPVVAQLLVPPAAQLLIAVQYELKERTERKKEIEKEEKNQCKLCQCHCSRRCRCNCMSQDQYRCTLIQSWRSCWSRLYRNYWKLSNQKDEVRTIIQKKIKDHLTSARGSTAIISRVTSARVGPSTRIGAGGCSGAGAGRAGIAWSSTGGSVPTGAAFASVLTLTPPSGGASSMCSTRDSNASICRRKVRRSFSKGKNENLVTVKHDLP